MSVLLVWSLEAMLPPCIITSEIDVIDLTGAEHEFWAEYISPENRQRVISEVHRWKSAVEAGADANQAYGYAIGGAGIDYRTWLVKNTETARHVHTTSS
jgi:hypothetical protein